MVKSQRKPRCTVIWRKHLSFFQVQIFISRIAKAFRYWSFYFRFQAWWTGNTKYDW